MLNTLSQPMVALWIFLFGMIAGVMFGITRHMCKVIKYNTFKIIADIISCLAVGVMFVWAVTTFNGGEIRIFLIVSYMLGLLIERKTVGILFAKLFDSVYNSVAKLVASPKTKLGKIIFK